MFLAFRSYAMKAILMEMQPQDSGKMAKVGAENTESSSCRY